MVTTTSPSYAGNLSFQELTHPSFNSSFWAIEPTTTNFGYTRNFFLVCQLRMVLFTGSVTQYCQIHLPMNEYYDGNFLLVVDSTPFLMSLPVGCKYYSKMISRA